MFRIAILVSLLSISFSIYAYDAASAVTEVKQIYTDKNGGIYVHFGNDSMQGCHSNNGAYVVKGNVEGVNNILTILLTAKTAKQKVQVLYDYTGIESGWSMCHIHGVYIK
jgi:hypothetical protein